MIGDRCPPWRPGPELCLEDPATCSLQIGAGEHGSAATSCLPIGKEVVRLFIQRLANTGNLHAKLALDAAQPGARFFLSSEGLVSTIYEPKPRPEPGEDYGRELSRAEVQARADAGDEHARSALGRASRTEDLFVEAIRFFACFDLIIVCHINKNGRNVYDRHRFIVPVHHQDPQEAES